LLFGQTCQSCLPFVYLNEASSVDLTTVDCSKLIPLGGLLFETNSENGQPALLSSVFGETVIDSDLFERYGPVAYRTCRPENKRNATSCQLLANLCVLNLYRKREESQSDLCDSLTSITTNSTSNQPLPWIYYTEDFNNYSQEYVARGVDDGDSSEKYLKIELNSNNIGFYAAEYSWRGELTGYGEFDFNRLNLCNSVNTSAFSLSTVRVKCSVKVESLYELGSIEKLAFFDLFLRYGNGSTLFPIPVQISENSLSQPSQIYRRVFLAESITSRIFNPAWKREFAVANESRGEFVRYPKSVTINITLLENNTGGAIYPPRILIVYAYAKRSDLNKRVDVEFRIEYKMSLNSNRVPFFALIGSLGGLAFVWSTFRAWNWHRRAGRVFIDSVLMFKYIMFLIGSVANAILATLFVTSLYFLIFYRCPKNKNFLHILYCKLPVIETGAKKYSQSGS
jgi:hypothetical protein